MKKKEEDLKEGDTVQALIDKFGVTPKEEPVVSVEGVIRRRFDRHQGSVFDAELPDCWGESQEVTVSLKDKVTPIENSRIVFDGPVMVHKQSESVRIVILGNSKDVKPNKVYRVTVSEVQE